MVLKLVQVVYTVVYTMFGPMPMKVCIYVSPEIEYDVLVYQPLHQPCAEYRDV
jgi:hypothetical protein